MEEDWGIRDPEHELRLKTFAMALPVEFGIETGGAVGFLSMKLYSYPHQASKFNYSFPGKMG